MCKIRINTIKKDEDRARALAFTDKSSGTVVK